MNEFDKIKEKAEVNYQNYKIDDGLNWYEVVDKVLNKVIYRILDKHDYSDAVILNAGSGGQTYNTKGKLIHLDLVKSNIKQFEHYLVGSIESMPISDNSVDILICVGSVLNYTNQEKSIKEFNRVLKKNGILILEFERSNSGEFLFNKNHHKQSFLQKYEYNKQEHLLMMYNEKFIINQLKDNGFKLDYKKRFHTLSTLLYRLGMKEERAAKYAKGDWLLKPLSYSLAHNVVLVLTKI
ncbi:MAG: class I SAM-dependent methyltransferase [Bacilli bacterium]|nr:class I SAM-dependent methyltransferase [Bacilli bacterium]